MNQKTIFLVIGAILVLQGIAFLMMGDKVISGAFPNVDDTAKYPGVTLLHVVAMLSIAIGLISFAARNSPQVLWGYALGFSLLTLLTLKHLLMDHINVPIPALVIQIGIALACIYLWIQSKKGPASA
jgi:hypothetical protein